MEKKITILGVWKEGWSIGIRNVFPLLGTFILYLLTIWIPYINVGTTIAMSAIPVELSKGHAISPVFIFKARYRRYMGEFFVLVFLQGIATILALPMLIPAIVISQAWSLAICLFVDKKISPVEALMKSNDATYGYKWTIFFSILLVYLIGYLIVGGIIYFSISQQMDAIMYGYGAPMDITTLVVIICLFYIILMPFVFACKAVIYRNLTAEEQPAANLSGSTAETTEPAAGE